MNNNNNNINKNIVSILEINDKKKIRLGEVLNISLQINDAVKNLGEESTDEITEYMDKRGTIIDDIKNMETAVKYYVSKLGESDLVKYETIRRTNLFSDGIKNTAADMNFEFVWERSMHYILKDQNELLYNIKKTDEENNAAINALMNDIKQKIKYIKSNRKLMNKYIADDEIKTGALMHDKK